MKNYFISFFVLAFCLLSPLQAAEPDFFTITNRHSSEKLTAALRYGSYVPTHVTLKYRIISKEGVVGDWQDYNSSTAGNGSSRTIADIPAGAKLQLYGTNTSGFGQSKMKRWALTLAGSGEAVLSGELMSVFSGTETAIDNTRTLPSFAFCNFFYDINAENTRIFSAKDLKLSATNLGTDCYFQMFYECSNMVEAPLILPATTLTTECYMSMFSNCKALTTTPVLPATTLASSCYAYMFNGCTSLTTAPALPATALATACYSNMFSGCSSLVNFQEELPASDLPQNCYQYMFQNCTSLTTAPEIAATTIGGSSACAYMFTGCTALTKAPSELYATSLPSSCYKNMFASCSNLVKAPNIHATSYKASNGGNVMDYMFSGCTKLNAMRIYYGYNSTSAVELPMGSNYWVQNVENMGAFYCPPTLNRTFSPTTNYNKLPKSTDYPWTVFSYNLTYIPVGGEWPKGGTAPQQYTWQTDTNYVQGWMRELDAAGAAYYHDEACTQQFPESEIIAFLATQQESSSSITKNIYVKLGVVDYPESERYEYVIFPLEEEDQHEFECSPGSTPDPETPEGNTCDHNWVQLWEGGPKWATMNVGASSETDAGDYFMWGGTTANPSSCSWSNCPYKGTNQNTAPYTKYGLALDGNLDLDEDDDAAAKEWGCGWRIPTREEYNDLLTKCTVTYNYSKRGYTFTSKENPTLSIFMPTAGYKNGGSVFNVGKFARYLTATSTTSPSINDSDCYILYWYTNSSYQEDHKPETNTQSVRYWGMSVRAVHD